MQILADADAPAPEGGQPPLALDCLPRVRRGAQNGIGSAVLDLRRPRLTVLDVHNAYGVLLHLDADPGPPAADVEDAGIKALDQALEHVTRA